MHDRRLQGKAPNASQTEHGEAGGWGGSQSDYSVCPLLLMLEVDFMLHVSQVYKDVELDNNFQLSNHCPFQSVQTDQ